MKRGPIVPTLSAFARFALALLASTLWGALTASAADFGTAVEARSLLERAVAALRADTAAALAKFNRGDDGLRDRDLYVFCVNASDARPPPMPIRGSLAATCASWGSDRKAFGEKLTLRRRKAGHQRELFVPAPGLDDAGGQGILCHPRGWPDLRRRVLQMSALHAPWN